MERDYFYKVDDVNQLENMKFCPYCGSDTMYVYLGDWHNYTVCLECEDELEFMAVVNDPALKHRACNSKSNSPNA